LLFLAGCANFPVNDDPIRHLRLARAHGGGIHLPQRPGRRPAIANQLRGKFGDGPISVVVGYDTRFASEDFGRISAEVVAGNGIRVYLSPKAVPTPIASFGVGHARSEKLSTGGSLDGLSGTIFEPG
jgi:hypothetical protein